MGTQDPKKENLLYLDQITLQDVPNRAYMLRLFVENEEREVQRKDNHTWTPAQRPDVSPTSQIRAEVRMNSSHSVWAKYRDAGEVIELDGLFRDYWSSNNHEFIVLKAVFIGKHSGYLEVRFSANDTAEALRSSLHELEGLLKEYTPVMSGSVERSVDRAFKYGAVFAELNPIAKAIFGVTKVTFELLKEQKKYDQMPSGLCDRVQRILPLAKKVADEIVSEETEILKELIPRMFEVMHSAAKLSCDYVKRARTAGGPAFLEMIEEMDRELNNVIEDFDRAVYVEALRLANETKRVERADQERIDQKLLFRRLKPVETGYHLKLRCVDGTRQYLLNQITDWVANKSGQEDVLQRNALWFYGSPGIGKTSFAHSICASLHERNHLAGAFFCRRDDPNLSEPINILPTFIHRLAELFPPFRTIVAKYLRDDPNLTPESMKGSLFVDFVHSLPRHPEHTLAFIIDALDECGDAQSRPPLLKVLTNAAAQAPWLKIIVTSRTEVDIQHFFDTLTQSSYLSYDLATVQDANADLRAFARSQFDLVATPRHLGTLDTPEPMRGAEVALNDQLPIEPDEPQPLGRTETFRKIFSGRKPTIDEGPHEPIPDVAPFAPSLPFPVFATPLPPSRILEPMRGAMSPIPGMRISPKFRARDIDPTPQQIAEKELRKMERQFAREKSKGVFGSMRRNISKSKPPTPGYRFGHQASASMSNVNPHQNRVPASAPAPAFRRAHHASISKPSHSSQRQAQPQPPSPKPPLAWPPPSPRRYNDLPDGYIPPLEPDGSICIPPPHELRLANPNPTPRRYNDLPSGYIPPLEPDGSISLPPPHELRGAMVAAISREPSPTPRRYNDLPDGYIPPLEPTGSIGLPPPHELWGAMDVAISYEPSPTPSTRRSPHSRARANSLSQRRMGFVHMTQEGLLLPEAIQVLPDEDEDDQIPVPQLDVVPAANPGDGRGWRRVPMGRFAMSTPMSQFSILDKDQDDRQYHHSREDALGLKLSQGSMSTDENLIEEPIMKSYPSITGLSIITEHSGRGVSHNQIQRTHVLSPASAHQTPHMRNVPVPKTPEAHGLDAIQNVGHHGEGASSIGYRRPEDDDEPPESPKKSPRTKFAALYDSGPRPDNPPEPPNKSPRTKLAALYNSRPHPENLTIPAPLPQSQTPLTPSRSGYAGAGAGGGRRYGQGSRDVPEDITRPWTIPTPSYIPMPVSPNLQSAAAATSLSTHEDSTIAPTRARSRAGSMYNDPFLDPTTGPKGGLYRHGSGSEASLISNKTTASMRMVFDPSAYVDPAYDVAPPDIESELDLSGGAAGPSRKAVSAHIGDAMTSVWKRPKKEKKAKK